MKGDMVDDTCHVVFLFSTANQIATCLVNLAIMSFGFQQRNEFDVVVYFAFHCEIFANIGVLLIKIVFKSGRYSDILFAFPFCDRCIVLITCSLHLAV